MKITRLEPIELYKSVRTTLPDSQRTESLELVQNYLGIIQYLYNDEVAVAMYGADIAKIHRIATIYNELENFLIPKVKNKNDNVSNSIIKYNDTNIFNYNIRISKNRSRGIYEC